MQTLATTALGLYSLLLHEVAFKTLGGTCCGECAGHVTLLTKCKLVTSRVADDDEGLRRRLLEG